MRSVLSLCLALVVVVLTSCFWHHENHTPSTTALLEYEIPDSCLESSVMYAVMDQSIDNWYRSQYESKRVGSQNVLIYRQGTRLDFLGAICNPPPTSTDGKVLIRYRPLKLDCHDCNANIIGVIMLYYPPMYRWEPRFVFVQRT